MCEHSSAFIFAWIVLFLLATRTCIRARMSLNFNQIRPLTRELPALERLNNQCIMLPSFLIGSSSFLQVTRTTIKSLMSSKFGQIQSWTAKLAALDRVTKSVTYLRTIKNILMTCWLSGESEGNKKKKTFFFFSF